jgi:hypothetical protein
MKSVSFPGSNNLGEGDLHGSAAGTLTLEDVVVRDGAPRWKRPARRGHSLVLGHVVEVVGDAGVVVVLQWPIAAHLLKGHPSEQYGVSRFPLFTDRVEDVGLIGVLVSTRGEPAISSVDDAVDGDVLGDDQSSQVWVLIRSRVP